MSFRKHILVFVAASVMLPASAFAEVDLRTVEQEGRRELQNVEAWMSSLNFDKVLASAEYIALKSILAAMDRSVQTSTPEMVRSAKRVVFVSTESVWLAASAYAGNKGRMAIWSPSEKTKQWLIEYSKRQAALTEAQDRFLNGSLKAGVSNKEALEKAETAMRDPAFLSKRPWGLGKMAYTLKSAGTVGAFLGGMYAVTYVASDIAYLTLDPVDFQFLHDKLGEIVTKLSADLEDKAHGDTPAAGQGQTPDPAPVAAPAPAPVAGPQTKN